MDPAMNVTHPKGAVTSAEQLAELARARGWFVKKWEDGHDLRIIATHETKPGIDICLNLITDASGYSRTEVFTEAAKRL
jgi:hypothetical protein